MLNVFKDKKTILSNKICLGDEWIVATSSPSITLTQPC